MASPSPNPAKLKRAGCSPNGSRSCLGDTGACHRVLSESSGRRVQLTLRPLSGNTRSTIACGGPDHVTPRSTIILSVEIPRKVADLNATVSYFGNAFTFRLTFSWAVA